MKINLLRNTNDVLSGYLNIDPFTMGTDTDKVAGGLTDLSYHVDDAEASEIIARDILDYFDPPTGDRALENWIRKLRHGGKLVVGGTDLYEVAKAITNYSLLPEAANKLLYGSFTQPWEMKKHSTCLLATASWLEVKGLHVIKKRLNNFSYCVEAQRP